MKFCRLPSGFLVAYRTAKLFSRKKFRFEKSTCIPGNLSHAGCLPHSTSWGWLTSAGSGGAAPLWQHTETLRNGEGQMELLLFVPGLLLALETRSLTEVRSTAKSPAVPLGLGPVS